MTAKQILEELQAEEELLRRGWTKNECDSCKGIGNINVSTAKFGHLMYPCALCHGDGYIWTNHGVAVKPWLKPSSLTKSHEQETPFPNKPEQLPGMWAECKEGLFHIISECSERFYYQGQRLSNIGRNKFWGTKEGSDEEILLCFDHLDGKFDGTIKFHNVKPSSLTASVSPTEPDGRTVS